jgi:polyisoprenoid-binding protein YceI
MGILFSQGWKIDKSHTTVGFSIRHMAISIVDGRFKEFNGEVIGENLDGAKVSLEIDAASIFTNSEKRDNHLRAPDFFDVKKYPKIIFEGKLKKNSGKMYKLSGKFLMHGVTKNLELDAELLGTVKDPWGNTRAGFTVRGKLDRYDYGLKWNNVLESGNFMVGKEVKLNIQVELIKK